MEAQAPIGAARPGPEHSPSRAAIRTPRRRLLADRLARWAVTLGGLVIIASILGILIFILIEVAPLGRGATVVTSGGLARSGPAPAALLSDEHRSHVALFSKNGRITVIETGEGQDVLELDLLESIGPHTSTSNAEGETAPAGRPGIDDIRPVPGQQMFAASTTDGRVLVVPVAWDVSFVEQTRSVKPRISPPTVFELDPLGRPLGAFAVRIDDDGLATAAAQLADGSLAILHRKVEENLFTEERTLSWERFETDSPVRLSALVMDEDQRNLFGGAASGELVWWRLSSGRPDPPLVDRSESSAVTALSLLIGDRSLVAGRADGSTAIWFPVRQPDESFVLTRIRSFTALTAAIELIAPSLRDKGLLVQDSAGDLALYYSTSERVLWQGRSPLPEATALFYTPKADGAYLGGPGGLSALDIRNPHPEVGWTALFGKVWYEGYEEPACVWQSTGGTDDFEPKLSLTPLMFGTFKGTIYSLFLAIPLGVLGAMYTSQFMHYTLKRYVKPTVEIMAALPSVVLGFLAGLWLAPRLERVLPGLLLMSVLMPLAVLLAGYLWRALPLAVRGRFRPGSESLLYLIVVAAAIWLSLELSQPVEAFVFGGDVRQWLLNATGLRYDQRNAVVVGLAMGFAVIPIIFSIAEDAFSNVPQTLTSGSLALGATRWQTVTRVVLPTASPGIFSAIMIGFGRAVGETMIVLMATGNTPVLDWNPFNGFRTLSANIAVEIPEAPHGATLYRALFLAALLLFAFTFLINTVAELVRQRLRQRYSQL